MQRTSRTTLTTSSLILGCLVSACGGGGGGGGPSGGQNPNGPTVNAGTDTVVAERDTVTLTGAATENPAGGAVTTFQWVQTSGMPVVLRDADQQSASFVAMDVTIGAPEVLTFRFTATDAAGESSFDDVLVTVEDSRVAGGVTVYVAEQQAEGQREVYACDTRGAEPSYLISGGAQHSGDVDVQIVVLSPDEKWAAYIADERVDGLPEVFVARTDGTGSSLAHAPLGNSDEIREGSIFWSPVPDAMTGEHRLAFIAEIASNAFELYTTVPGTGLETKVSGPISASSGDVMNAKWAPDGSRLAYRADADQSNLIELFTTLSDSPNNAVKVSATLQPAGDVSEFSWSPRSDQLAYRADGVGDNRFELFVCGATSSGAVRVSQPLGANEDVLPDFAWTPDASADPLRIAYRADAAADGVNELFTTTPDGSEVIRENTPLPSGGDVHQLTWSPDGARIAYVADGFENEVNELFVATPGPSANAPRVSGTMTSGGDVIFAGVRWSPDASAIAYVADQDTNNVLELYVSRADGTTNLRVSGTMQSGGDVNGERVEWSPTGARIAYIADQNEDGTEQLFTSDPEIGPTSNTIVSGRPVPGGEVTDGFGWSRDGGRLVYQSDQNTPNVVELWSTNADFEPTTAAENPRLSGMLVMNSSGDTTGDVLGFVMVGRPRQ